MLTVVVDANVIVRDLRLESAPIQLLLEQSRTGLLNLVVPEAVYREIIGSRERRLRAHLDSIEKTRREIDRLGANAGLRDVAELTADCDADARQYDQFLRSALARSHVSMPMPDEDVVLRLVERAIARRRPFNEQGHGFRDALVWEHVLAAAEGDEVVLLSDDKVFSDRDTGDLIAELQHEVDEIGRVVRLLRSAHDFAFSYISADPLLHRRLVEAVEADQPRLQQLVIDAVTSVLSSTEGSSRSSARVVSIDGIAVARSTAASGADGRVAVELSTDITLSIATPTWTSAAASLFDTGPYGRSGLAERLPGLDDLGEQPSVRTVTDRVLLTASFDLSSGIIDDVAVEHFRTTSIR